MNFGKLGSVVTVANTLATPYTVPATSIATVNLNVVNAGSTDAKVKIAISLTPSPAQADYIEYNVVISPGCVLERTGITCGANENITILSDVTGVVMRVHGIEETA
jgi:hypothetical protein